MAGTPQHAETLDRDEVARFAKLSSQWWDEHGTFRQLHRINPVRLAYIRDQLCRRFGRDAREAGSLSGLSILDIGGGGGLLFGPPAGPRALVTRLDPAGGKNPAAKNPPPNARLRVASSLSN